MGEELTYIRRSMVAMSPHVESAEQNDVAKFATNMVAPLKKLTVQVGPQQDLHRQDYPYPPGSTNNLIPDGTDTSNGYVSDCCLLVDGTEDPSDDYYISEYFPVTEGQDYVYSTNNIVATIPSVCFYDSSKQFISGVAVSANHQVVVTAPVGAVYARASQHTMERYVARGHLYQFEAGSTATTIKPYSNICPFTYFTEANIYDDPKYGGIITWNQFVNNGNFESTDGWARSSSYMTLSVSNNVGTMMSSSSGSNRARSYSQSYAFLPDHKYLAFADIKRLLETSTAGSIASGYGIVIGDVIVETSLLLNEEVHLSKVVVPGQTNAKFGFRKSTVNPGSGAKPIMSIKNFCMFDLTMMFGADVADAVYALDQETAGAGEAWFRNIFGNSEYFAYNAGEKTIASIVAGTSYNHILVDWEDEVGEVAGGELTINADGSATIVRKYRTVDGGNQGWKKDVGSYWTFYFDWASDTQQDSNKQTVWSSQYKPVTANSGSTVDGDNYVWMRRKVSDSQPQSVRVKDTSKSSLTAAQFKTAMTGVKFMVLLKEENWTTYQLTAQQLKTVIGSNNVFSDTGSTDVSYWKHG